MERTPELRRYDESSLSVTDGSRKKRRGYDGFPIPSINDYCANQWTYNDYTVAVVCAMGFEMSAVRYMLDNEHPRLPIKQGDLNLYVLGELSGHNVVIACLPGTQGKGAAAIVANNMQRTFPSIKWRLLVGIGGGVPSPTHDIRLGDIVVSMPDGLFGGVVQYDLGKDVEDGFTLKGFLWPPPPILRSAVEMMRSDHLTKSNKANTFLSEMLQKWPGLADYQRPPADSDVLFQTDYPHVPDQATCRKCEKAQIVDRLARGSDNPKIHYGLIASGDRVMRSAMKRNKTGRDIGDILCFEMEAAGIMTEFPCIVIRGISDYADSHKNDKWQHYAAAAAAGCAKELLSYLDPEDRQVPPILTLQQPLHGEFNVSRGLPGSANIPTRRQGSPAQQSTVLGQHPRGGTPSLSEEHKRMLLDSLKFDQIDARQMTIKKAHAKTCRWLLSKPEYLDWLDNTKLREHHGFLWMKGKPGTGKSTIMKFALVNARKTMKDRIIKSFFFNARGEDLEKSTVGLYRALLSEILERVPELQCVFDPLELRTWNSGGHHQWGVELLKDLFEQAILRLEQASLMCFIDALDECAEHQVRDMISFFEHVGERTVDAGIHFRVLFSSRHYPYITIKRGLELILEGQEGHIQDITNYVNSELKIGHSNRAMQIRGELQQKASGVFMWVILVVGILNKEYDRGRVHALQQILHRIPGDLHELFRDILTRDSHNRNELLLCIQWVLFARQPLKPEELYFAILSSIEPEALAEWNTDVITIDVIRRFILNSSKGLAEITRSKAPTVQFIHESVRDFLLKENGLCKIWPDFGSNLQGQSHDQLKQCCSTYINVDVSRHVDLNKPLAKASSKEAASLRESVAKTFPFLEYAVRNVLYHADAAEGSGIAQGDFIQGFQLSHWVQLDNLFEKHEVRRHTQTVSLLYILAESNLSNLIGVHPCVLSCFDVEGERYRSPFCASLATGSGEALRTFMQAYTANMHRESRLRVLCDKYCQDGSRNPSLGRDFRFSKQRTILSYIAELGDEVVFAVLLETGKFMPDSRDKDGRTPLSWAAVNGNGAVVKLLLATGQVDPDPKDNFGRTPLSWAAENGNEVVVKLLLATGQVDPDSKDSFGQTPLSWAAENGNEATVKLLLATGQVNPNSKDNGGQTPLSLAAVKGNEAVVKLLLAIGQVDPDFKDNSGQTPLLLAAATGDEAIVKLLLITGRVDPDPKDAYGRTLLSRAAATGNEATVKLLLATGQVDPDSKDNRGQTPLSWAAGKGNEAIVKLLLATGQVNPDSKDKYGKTLLSRAAENGNEAIVKLLLATGQSNPDSKDKYGKTLLSWAAENGNEAIVKLLLATGQVNPNSKDNGGQTPLSWAAENGNEAIVKLLLATGQVDPDSKDNFGRTPLSRAAENGNEAIVKLLLITGQVDPDSQDNFGRTPLSRAAAMGNRAIVNLVLANSSSRSEQDMWPTLAA
jgi:ankyrin repeat protein/nucleoside phosphorylase